LPGKSGQSQFLLGVVYKANQFFQNQNIIPMPDLLFKARLVPGNPTKPTALPR
jgi:hypothetical protein